VEKIGPLKSTPQTRLPNLNNRKMTRQVVSHFLHSAQNFLIERINWFAIGNSDNQNSMIFGRREIQNV